MKTFVISDTTYHKNHFKYTDNIVEIKQLEYHTERNVRLNLDPTDKKIYTERNTGS